MVGARPIRTAPICARARRADLRSRGRPQRPQSTASLPLHVPSPLAGECGLRVKLRSERVICGCMFRAHPNFPGPASSWAGLFLRHPWSGASVLRSADSGCKRSTLNSARSRHSTGLPRVLARPARSATGLPVIANALDDRALNSPIELRWSRRSVCQIMGVRHYFCLPARPEASAKSVVQKKLIDSQTFHTTGAAEAL